MVMNSLKKWLNWFTVEETTSEEMLGIDKNVHNINNTMLIGNEDNANVFISSSPNTINENNDFDPIALVNESNIEDNPCFNINNSLYNNINTDDDVCTATDSKLCIDLYNNVSNDINIQDNSAKSEESVYLAENSLNMSNICDAQTEKSIDVTTTIIDKIVNDNNEMKNTIQVNDELKPIRNSAEINKERTPENKKGESNCIANRVILDLIEMKQFSNQKNMTNNDSDIVDDNSPDTVVNKVPSNVNELLDNLEAYATNQYNSLKNFLYTDTSPFYMLLKDNRKHNYTLKNVLVNDFLSSLLSQTSEFQKIMAHNLMIGQTQAEQLKDFVKHQQMQMQLLNNFISWQMKHPKYKQLQQQQELHSDVFSGLYEILQKQQNDELSNFIVFQSQQNYAYM